jgi:hypothetical protein
MRSSRYPVLAFAEHQDFRIASRIFDDLHPILGLTLWRWMPDSGYANLQLVGYPVMHSSSEEEHDKVRRFKKAVRELIEEGHWFPDHQALLEATATRAGVDLQEVLPTSH